MSSSEEDLDYNPENGSSEGEFDSSVDSNVSGNDSEISESEAEFTDDEENNGDDKKSKKSKAVKNNNKKKNETSKKRSAAVKKTKQEKKEKRSRFLDTEAQVGDETDEDDEGAEEFLEDFIAGSDEEEEAAAAAEELRQNLPRRAIREEPEEEFDAEAEERRLKALYGRTRESAKAASSSAVSTVPRPFLLPTVTDPKLWLCKAQQGRERSSALALLRVIMERQFAGQPLQLFSVIARDGLKGYVYIEAHKPIHIAQAIEIARLNHCMYPGQAGKSLVLVPLAEMPQVLQTTSASGAGNSAASASDIPEIGSWVRVKRGRYANDLAQVIDNAQDEGSYDPSNPNTCIIRLKLLPRLSFTSSSQRSAKDRAPPRVFDPEEASKYGPVSKSRGYWIFGGEMYREGFLYKNIRLSSLITEAVNPTTEELARFPDSDRGSSSFTDSQDHTASSGTSSEISLAPGDKVVILEGEMKNLQASVDSLEWRSNPSNGLPEQFAHLLADPSTGLQGEAAKFFIKVVHLHKIFATGAQIRIVSGPHRGESGIVVALDNSSKNLIIYSAGSNQQFTVPSGFCVLAQVDAFSAAGIPERASRASSASAPSLANDYALDDLVQFEVEAGGEEGVGVVIRILDSENSVAVFDSLGQIRNVACRAVRLLANYTESNSHAAAFSSADIKQGDRVTERTSGGFFKILHIYKSLAFVKPLSGAIPSGTAAISVMPLDALAKPRPVPAFRSSNQGSPSPAGPSPIGHLMGKSVTITGGPQKGYVGFVKQITDNIARVELHTNGKVISVAVDKLALVGKSGPSSGNYRSTVPSSSSSHTTPAWNAPSSSARTPAWNSSSSSTARTPSWNSSSSRTPAWNSGKTPAWNPATTPNYSGSSSARTPAWNAAAGSGTTPAWNVPTAVGQSSTAANWQKGTTPTWNSSSSRTPAWQSSTASSFKPDQAGSESSKEKQPWDQVKNWNKEED